MKITKVIEETKSISSNIKNAYIDFSKTSSCYNPINQKGCGLCDSCLLRKKGFNEAQLIDPS